MKEAYTSPFLNNLDRGVSHSPGFSLVPDVSIQILPLQFVHLPVYV